MGPSKVEWPPVHSRGRGSCESMSDEDDDQRGQRGKRKGKPSKSSRKAQLRVARDAQLREIEVEWD
jgi:hypothetical protein